MAGPDIGPAAGFRALLRLTPYDKGEGAQRQQCQGQTPRENRRWLSGVRAGNAFRTAADIGAVLGSFASLRMTA